MNSLAALLPSLRLSSVELSILGLILLVLVMDLLKFKRKFQCILSVSVLGLIGILGFLILKSSQLIGNGFDGFYAVSFLDLFFKAVLIVGALFVILMIASRRVTKIQPQGESMILVLLGLLGASFVVSSNELITLFISVEILSFSSYILTSYIKKSRFSAEAGLKYLILGVLSSGFFLFGIALLYGLTGTTEFDLIRQQLPFESTLIIWTAFLFIFAGLAFKMGIFPFLFWVPDVYQGAPLWVGGFLSTVSKTAGFAAFLKVLSLFETGLGQQTALLMSVLAIATILYGNLGAFLQDDLKRLLGFSSIAHAGFLLLAFMNPLGDGPVVAFYLIIYTLSNLLVFTSIYLAGLKIKHRVSLTGLYQRSSFLATCLCIGLISLAGIPPMAGFIGKFALFLSAFDAKAYWPLAAALVGVLISIYYYFRVIKTAFTLLPEEEVRYSSIRLTLLAKITLIVLAGSVIVIGIYPFPILNLLF